MNFNAMATSGISLIAIHVSMILLLIQGWMKHNELDLKIQDCRYAYQSYQHLLSDIRETIRRGEFNTWSALLTQMNNIDSYVVDTSPIVDKFLTKYGKHFTGLIEWNLAFLSYKVISRYINPIKIKNQFP